MPALVFEQLFDPESCTFTYVIGDGDAGVCALVDPVREQVDRDLARVDALGLRLVHTIETHIHADHVTGGSALREKRGCKPIVHALSHVACDAELVRHGDVIRIGAVELHVLETPGHTPESISLYLPKGGAHEGDAVPLVLSGDALLIGTCGRTDFQNGDAGTLYDSVHAHLFTLPDDTRVYPCHDYKGKRSSTVGDEKRENARLANRTRASFVELMQHLGLPEPKRMHEAIPANLACGKDGSQSS